MDWSALMRAGVQGLGLQPDAFWRLTPVELQLMLGDVAGAAPLLSGGLGALMAAYPDKSDGS
jgi:uncharacterized phage protein (TIGR02216 family)